jgi:exopolysaccharide production protein ExoZ
LPYRLEASILGLKKPDGEVRTRLYSLELGRFIAAFIVLVCHLVVYVNRHAADLGAQVFGGMTNGGSEGVQYFFVLSGFVLAYAHHGDFGRIGAVPKFWWRRACRIYPTYWLALGVSFYYLYGTLTPALTLHLLSLDPNLMGNHYYLVEYIQAAWTLRFEIAFYLMFGLCLLPYIGKPILGLWVALSIWRWCGPVQSVFHPAFLMGPFYNFTLSYGEKFFHYAEFYFFAGLAAAFIFLRVDLSRRVCFTLFAASFVLFISLLPFEGWGAGYGTPLFMMLMSVVIASNILFLAMLDRHGVSARWGKYAVWAGAMSYPLYLFHEPVLLWVDINHPWGKYHLPGLYAHLVFFILTALAVSALVTVLFDRPVQRALRRLTLRVSGGWARRAAVAPAGDI